jgi:hypothetical protein
MVYSTKESFKEGTKRYKDLFKNFAYGITTGNITNFITSEVGSQPFKDEAHVLYKDSVRTAL